jgi:hypothetical protein
VPKPNQLEGEIMTSECRAVQALIQRSFVGDLNPEEQRGLDCHLASCQLCRQEQEQYAETLSLLQSAGDEPVPRHFFVYPTERPANPWHLFRQMMPRWQAATAGVATLFVLLSVVGITGFQVRADRGAWAVSFGRSVAGSEIDINALKADILRAAEERNRGFLISNIQNLRSEIARTQSDLTHQQQGLLLASLDRMETRVNNRISLTAEDLKAGNQKSALDVYQAVSLQHEQDVNATNARLDKVVDTFESRSRQTDSILETLLQIANLNLKQPGDQK